MTPLDIALGYAARGWCPIPIPDRQKGPKIKGWPGLRITDKNARDYFNGAAHRTSAWSSDSAPAGLPILISIARRPCA